MSQARNRWMVFLVLGLAGVGLLGASVAPLIAAFNNEQSSNEETATVRNTLKTSSPAAAQISKLTKDVQFYQRLSQEEPENTAALKRLIEARLQLLSLKQGDIKAVIEDLEKLVKKAPERAEYAVLLGQAKQQVGDKEGAAKAFRSALKTKPGDSKVLEAYVSLLLQQKRPQQAISLLKDNLSTAAKANKVEPGSIDVTAVQTLLGSVYAKENRYGEAIAAFDIAIKNDKQDFRPVMAKALLLKQQGKVDQAKPLFTKAAELAPAKYKDEINRQANSTPSPNPTASTTETPSSKNTPKE
ncbi:tetratricopeptide repeat protein [Mastigocoleus testarum]|uniref:Tfp pilus assembly protein PilF n=1 Tax=Mastigocoleus testarum BC008 TaxID=371196 RepID=A0A0V7ZZ13_9CYAN|nr:tetratricopeptide repeat protein [Mastigocoleus testarum]KST67595.1 Tfp pilus assembly protein PilF [Mastigocoleus testarum BC008]KST69769.1 Tfp pilus assembly protein PilF [Mastigocoleus testarum BC008]